MIDCLRFMPRKSMVAASAAALVLMTAQATAAPPQLLNKTVSVSFTMSAPAKGSDGSSIAGNRQVSRTIYISSQGRIFNRHDNREGRNTSSLERDPGKTNMRISGNQLVGVASHASGATQLVVTFSPDFRSCTMTATTGGEGGKPVTFKGLNGVLYTMTGKPQVSGPSCSVSDGNTMG